MWPGFYSANTVIFNHSHSSVPFGFAQWSCALPDCCCLKKSWLKVTEAYGKWCPGSGESKILDASAPVPTVPQCRKDPFFLPGPARGSQDQLVSPSTCSLG